MKRIAVALILFTELTSVANGQQQELDAALERNKNLIARYFALVDAGDVQALRSVVSTDYVEHASYAADGRDALLARIAVSLQTENGVRRERSELVRMIAERDEVWTYSRVTAAGTLMARIDMFRLEGNQVAEHWAVQEKVNPQRSNANDQFALGKGPQDFTRQPKRVMRRATAAEIARNKQVSRLFFQYAEATDMTERRKLIDIATPEYIQHNAGGQDGIAGFATRANPLPNHMNVRLLAEGDLVWSLNVPNFSQGWREGVERVNFNQWRIENGRLAEHTGTYESVPAKRANTNDFLGYGRTHTRDFSR